MPKEEKISSVSSDEKDESIDGFPFNGKFHKVIESEVTLMRSPKTLRQLFNDLPVDQFTDIYTADTNINNGGTRKMRTRSHSVEIGHKKGMPTEQHPYIRTRMEKGVHIENLEDDSIEFLRDFHTRGARVIREINKVRRTITRGIVQIAQTQILSAGLVLHGVNNRRNPVVIDLSHTDPYIDFEVESPPQDTAIQKYYDAIEKALEAFNVPDKDRLSISTRGIIVNQLTQLPPEHSLFHLEIPDAPAIISQCLRCDLAQTFTKKNIPKKWKGK